MFSIITLDESDKWDSIVKSFTKYDVYYLSGYTKAFNLHGDGDPILIYYHDEKNRAINVVMKRDIAKSEVFKDELPLNTYFDITTPYGYGGFIIEGEISGQILKVLDEKYTTICREKGIISEFVRFHPVTNNVNSASSIYDFSQLGKTITMELNSKSQIWDELTSKNRNVIRKALRSGVEIFWGRDPKLFDKFITLYNATMDKDNAEEYYYFGKDFYDSVISDLKYNSLMFYAMYEDKIIAMSMILFSNEQMHYHLSASEREYMKFAPTNLLLYKAACWGAENGYKSFHLGGGLGSKEDSLYKFKKAFNRSSETYFSIGKKIFDQVKYDELIEMRKENVGFDDNTLFFPIYRA